MATALRVRARAYLFVVLALGVFVGVTVINVLYTDHVAQVSRERDEQNRRQQDRDMCDLLDAIAPRNAPAPATDRGRTSLDAINAYRARRC